MPRFFVNKDSVLGSKVILTGSDINHIIKVLRKDIGDIIEVVDGSGYRYEAKIISITKQELIAEILVKQIEAAEKVKVTIFQSIPKSDKMETIIQKCTELGASRIVPFISERTVVTMDNEKIDKKLQRWRKIAQEACKQCKRAIIPEVTYIYSLQDILDEVSMYDLSIVAYEKEKISIKKILKGNTNITNISIIIGPEGGFTETEIKQLIEGGVYAVSLGKRILRTETAGMAVLCIIMYELGEME